VPTPQNNYVLLSIPMKRRTVATLYRYVDRHATQNNCRHTLE